MKKNLILFIVMLLINNDLKAQLQGGIEFGKLPNGNYETVLDMKLASCLRDSVAFIAGCNCYSKTSEGWKAEIERHVKIIRKNLGSHPEVLKQFDLSHKNWEEYAKNQVEAYYRYYHDFGKSRWAMQSYFMVIVDIYRDRDIDLQMMIINMDLR